MVTIKDKSIFINNEKVIIHSGSIHYFRSMPERWHELLLKLKDCGFNTVETYCAWNLHEPKQGNFDFSGRLDVKRFIETASELGLYVILRPGPYICAEWEFGGIPAWLLEDERFRFRTREGDYLKYCEKYFDELLPQLVSFSQSNGGNIIMIAAENEYGSFGDDREYMNKCADILRKYNFNIPIFTSDGHTDMFLKAGQADGCLCTLDYGYAKGEWKTEHYEALNKMQPDSPHIHMEHWDGMFSQWGEPFIRYSPEYVADEIRCHLRKNDNFNLYMFHGGTNFGFMNGANTFFRDATNPTKYKCYFDVTSYDYDALLTEWGEITPKYKAVQTAMSEYLGKKLPEHAPVPLMNIGEVELTESAGLFENINLISEHYTSVLPHNMEHYGQSYGYILYKTVVPNYKNINLLAITGFADRVNIYFNKIYRGTINRNDEKQYLNVDGWLDGGGILELLVENQGCINFGPTLDMGDRKGINGHVFIRQDNDGPTQVLYNWDVYSLPMDNTENLIFGNNVKTDKPLFYRGFFKAQEKKDCFIHFDGFKKGFILLNGFNLGRFWEIGPQKSLYLPKELLKDINEVIIFDEHSVKSPKITISNRHILDSISTDKKPKTIV